MNKQTRDIVQEYINKYSGQYNNPSAIASIVVEDKVLDKSHTTIRRYIKELQDNTKPNESKSDVLYFTPLDGPIEAPPPTIEDDPLYVEGYDEDAETGMNLLGNNCMADIHSLYNSMDFSSVKEKYTVDKLYYSLIYNKETFSIKVELVDKLFCAYSKKGMNLTKAQVQSFFKVDDNTFNAVFNRLNLTKDSEAYGPFTEEFMEPENIYSLVMNNVKELLSISNETDSATIEALVKEYKKAYVELANKNLRNDRVMREIADTLKTIKVPVLDRDVTHIKESPKWVNVVITDMHLGLQLPVFNYDIAREKLKQIAIDVNSMYAEKVYVSFLGDIIHTFSGVNHAGMWKTLESGAWGANSLTKPFELLREFLGSIRNLCVTTSVSGNHDRTLSDRELEESNEGAKLIFFMLKNSLTGIEVIHTDHRTVFDIGNIRFINLHGDQGLDKKSADKIAWKYGDQSKFNFILEGHYHSRIIEKDNDCTSYRKMNCPAFAPTDDYAERLGVGSASGWLMITEVDGLPKIIDTPINYESK